jgi:hypothetical protein
LKKHIVPTALGQATVRFKTGRAGNGWFATLDDGRRLASGDDVEVVKATAVRQAQIIAAAPTPPRHLVMQMPNQQRLILDDVNLTLVDADDTVLKSVSIAEIAEGAFRRMLRQRIEERIAQATSGHDG